MDTLTHLFHIVIGIILYLIAKQVIEIEPRPSLLLLINIYDINLKGF